ncbi:MAG: hypothetical protein GWP06_17975, partial [Actinobacteria bacterium]|nr:hypothetical protein [Actinomycetota bacterium]
MKRQLFLFSLIFIISFPLLHAFAQPNHTKLLYSDPLDNANSGTFSRFENNSGTFIAGRGWQAVNQNSQLFIEIPQILPTEGTMILDVTNFDPVSQNADTKQQIINLYSQENGSKDIFDTNGSWTNIRTGTGYTAGEGTAGFKFLAAPHGVDTRDEKRCIEDATWDLNATYEFKIIWTTSKIYCYFNGSEQAVFNFSGQVEAFRYIFLGTDNVYTAQPGPIYSNLRIYTTDGDPGTTESISFTDITSGAGT